MKVFNVDLIKDLNEFENQEINFKEYKYVFICTPDSYIKNYINKIPHQVKKIHFSGFLYSEEALGVHPLSSFSKSGEFDFSKIDFVVDGELDENLKKVFIKTHQIDGNQKDKYHTYISTAANALQLLVNQIGRGFEADMGLDSTLLKKIVIQSLIRELNFGEDSFSGPWMRLEEDKQMRVIDQINDESLSDLSWVFKRSIERYRNK